jgi:hypothetical protein
VLVVEPDERYEAFSDRVASADRSWLQFVAVRGRGLARL